MSEHRQVCAKMKVDTDKHMATRREIVQRRKLGEKGQTTIEQYEVKDK